MNIAVICAKSKSERLPHKNIKPLNGTPLIYYSLKAIQDSGLFDRIVISTDGLDVVEIVKGFGVDVPFLRPEGSERIASGTENAVNSVRQAEDYYGEKYTNIFVTCPTAPFITGQLIKSSFAELNKSKKPSLKSYCKTVSPWYTFKKVHGKPQALFADKIHQKTQHLESLYDSLNTSLYWCKRDTAFEINDMIFPDHCMFELTDPIHSIDIDTLEDFEFAEIVMVGLQRINHSLVYSSSKELYQQIYENHDWYGNSEVFRCPGVRLIPQYENHIKGKIIDLGCGRGHTVISLRDKGFKCDGVDQIEMSAEMMVGDITKDIINKGDYDSSICIDVIEHLTDKQLRGLWLNLAKTKYQAFSIHNGPSWCDGINLHINIKTFEQWENIITSLGFKIHKIIETHEQQRLFLTTYG